MKRCWRSTPTAPGCVVETVSHAASSTAAATTRNVLIKGLRTEKPRRSSALMHEGDVAATLLRLARQALFPSGACALQTPSEDERQRIHGASAPARAAPRR